MNQLSPLEAFAVSPPGFEDVVAAELEALGIAEVRREEGGVAFGGDWRHVCQANLGCRVASRILVRVTRFEATTFSQLERELGRVAWERWLPAGCAAEVRVAKRRTRLYHTGKVAEVVRRTLGLPEPGPGPAMVRLQVRIEGPEVTVSLDTSGEHLHRRGYRIDVGPAPLRENLAAGLLLRAGWSGAEPLLDPCCGSGTLPIEAALLALNVPPGRTRRFAFEGLPSFDPNAWEAVKREAEARVLLGLASPIFGSDRSPEAVALTARSARRAGLADQVQVAVAEVAELEPPAPTGLLVANPPYGRRLGGDRSALADLGQALRGPFRRWRWGVVLAGPDAERRLGLRAEAVFPFRSGGVRLRFAVGGARG